MTPGSSGRSILSKSSPVIGIVGSEGAYGRWLARFFRERMQLEVIGRDPADPDSPGERELVGRCDVVLFAAPIRATPGLIRDYVRIAASAERGQLWLDITSIKTEPVAAMLQSQAEVVGLHPMTAPPKSPTLKGRALVVCEARLDAWRGWLGELCKALEAECVPATPEHHDRVMALVQAMVHATHLAQAGVLREYAPSLGDLRALLPFRTAAFEMDSSVISRILSLNPAIYEDIQFGNPHAAPVIDAMLRQLSALREQLGRGDDAARTEFRQDFFAANRDALGETALAEGNYNYERIGYLLGDLGDPHALSIHLPKDRPGSLRALLHVFERHGVSIASLHSSRTPAGEVHFRLGFDRGADPQALRAAAAEVDASAIGRVLDGLGDVAAQPVRAASTKLTLSDLQRRAATSDDIPALLALREATMRLHMRNSGEDVSPEHMRARLLNGYEHAQVLLHDGAIVGLFKSRCEAQDWVVMQIQLAPHLQGQGLGRALLEQFINQARAAGHDVTLHVLKANPARALYERLGFVVEGEDAHEFHMRLPLH